jgi:hypothetical protein
VDAALNWLNRVRDLEDPARGFSGSAWGGRWRISCGGLVFLVRAPRDDPDRVVRQRPLQRLGLVPWRQTSRSSSVSKMTGMAFGWIGSTTAFGDVVRKP